ncbi:SURF1 family cytochrome oxidase biogenesis protein [Temperatibacter marinus]|uniref:SURF1-like protein n=1 Tax=Temperatibacter marinus TaxID=1456591 RepID=A0AA52EI09_9PROT|nr:SURF1 family cytochrome oxidase biogenesis protein [Temperatibacter marinus]WND02907.1 SURF1 family cytochrome oxidase biogenesis protein [Temperatibacter marinus]
MQKFRPSLALSICTLLGLAVLFSLGTWQAVKVGPKQARIQKVNERFSLPAIDVSDLRGALIDNEFRHVKWSGELVEVPPYRHFLTNKKGEAGYHLYKPLKDNTGKVLLVNYGWVPFEYDITQLKWPTGPISVRGYIRKSVTALPFQPDNDAVNNFWYVANLDEMCAPFVNNNLSCADVRLILNGDETAFPLQGQMAIKLPNRHREYAFTWFGIAAALIAVFVGFGLQRGRELAQENNK